MTKIYKDVGVVIRSRKYGEADRLITLFTRQNGKVTFIAKGVRRLKSRKRGHLDLFSSVSFSAVRGNSLDILSEVKTLSSHPELKVNLKKATLAYFMSEVVDKLTQEKEEHTQIYTSLKNGLGDVVSRTDLLDVRKAFVRELLVVTGFADYGQDIPDPDAALAVVSERKMVSARVGKQLVT